MKHEDEQQTTRELSELASVIREELTARLGRAPTPQELGASIFASVHSSDPELASRADQYVKRLALSLLVVLDAGSEHIDSLLARLDARGFPRGLLDQIADIAESQGFEKQARALRARLKARDARA